ncbi:MAG: hypothetical protein F4204_16300 [Rhodospirillaceae bacterium]|nr:hypothetical protein [Rhodospirillaceae bacterium]MYG53850.1 hypothetical protein [Rhodospirillaceae bacterium]MYH37011.1 hypothetical protein [Rhodospirillaceae bacterium]MYK14927.1 hypothetical protein [Rhodospirillaceae bacterium]MYK58831.1 hypothetical protein [Rhodospirillaceae bacterium]
MGNTVNKHLRVDEDEWKRIEEAARQRGVSPTRLLISSTLQAIDGDQWPRTDAEIYLLRSAMFAAQAIARDMEAAGRGDEIEEIARNISCVAPELPLKNPSDGSRNVHSVSTAQPKQP